MPSGQASDLLELIHVEQDVKIEVTAQDGKTTTDLYDPLYQRKSDRRSYTSNADLRSLKIGHGLMTPNFKPSVTESTVRLQFRRIHILLMSCPKPTDPLAEIRVLAGTREIGNYDGHYAEALEDGRTPSRLK